MGALPRDPAEFDLDPVFVELRELRRAYRDDVAAGCPRSDDQLARVRGSLARQNVVKRVNDLLHESGYLHRLPRKQRQDLLREERRRFRAKLAVPRVRDSSLLRDAVLQLEQLEDSGSRDWAQSCKELGSFLADKHSVMRSTTRKVNAFNLLAVGRNRRAVKIADTAAVAVGIVLIDAIESHYFRASYGVGTMLARSLDDRRS